MEEVYLLNRRMLIAGWSLFWQFWTYGRDFAILHYTGSEGGGILLQLPGYMWKTSSVLGYNKYISSLISEWGQMRCYGCLYFCAVCCCALPNKRSGRLAITAASVGLFYLLAWVKADCIIALKTTDDSFLFVTLAPNVYSIFHWWSIKMRLKLSFHIVICESLELFWFKKMLNGTSGTVSYVTFRLCCEHWKFLCVLYVQNKSRMLSEKYLKNSLTRFLLKVNSSWALMK